MGSWEVQGAPCPIGTEHHKRQVQLKRNGPFHLISECLSVFFADLFVSDVSQRCDVVRVVP